MLLGAALLMGFSACGGGGSSVQPSPPAATSVPSTTPTSTPSPTPPPLPVGTSIRVQSTAGGPRIHVNGVPVPGRFFYATRLDQGYTVGDAWQDQGFDFTPFKDVMGKATLHLRFAKSPGDYFIRDIRVVDVDTGTTVFPDGSFASSPAFTSSWSSWPQGAANTVGTMAVEQGALHVTIQNPASGVWPDFVIFSKYSNLSKDHRYRCSFSIRGSAGGVINPIVYASADAGRVSYTRIGAPPTALDKEVVMARDAGVRFISVAMPACWDPPGMSEDWSPVDTLMTDILRMHPQALVVPRVELSAPGWWMKLHPESVMTFEDGTKGACPSVSSQAYRDDVSAQLEKLCRHLCQAFPDNFAGIHPAGQSTNEWFYENAWEKPLGGYDLPTRDAWRTYLQALGQAGAATAEIPSAAVRHGAPSGVLRDPAAEATLIQFNQFWQKQMADTVLQLAAAARRGTDGTRLVLFFYGYLFEFASMTNGASNAGHYALNRVLQSPDIDILCSPCSYDDREWAATGPCMSAVESAALHGKVWLNEDDSQTCLVGDGAAFIPKLDTMEQTLDVLRRNLAQAAIRGMALWWMDLTGRGWQLDTRIWDLQRQFVAMDKVLLSRPKPFMPEIALMVDELSMCHLAAGGDLLSRPLIYNSRRSFGRCGAPYGQYLVTDLVDGKISAKLQVHLASWAMSSDVRKALALTRQSDAVRVWCYAPGYLGSDKADPAYMNDLTGFACKAVDLPNPVATPTALGKSLGLYKAWGQTQKITPLFTLTPAAGDSIWATYSDGNPSVVVRKTSHGTDIFMGTPLWTPELARALAQVAGVHLYTTSNTALWADDHIVSIHALQDGVVSLDLGVDGAVVEATDGSTQGQGPSLNLTLRKGETRILKTSRAH